MAFEPAVNGTARSRNSHLDVPSIMFPFTDLPWR